MNDAGDVMQQPIRKAVGRPPSPRKVLWQLEQIREFTRKHTHGKPALAEGDALPVRKAVGRPRRAGVDFAVGVGVAVVLNGFNRNTNDVDILVDPEPANLTRLLGITHNYDLPILPVSVSTKLARVCQPAESASLSGM